MPDLRFQKWVTILFIGGYFGLIAMLVMTYVGGGPIPFQSDGDANWLKGILATLIGVLTGAVKDQCQFWFGSSNGSITKDRPPAPQL